MPQPEAGTNAEIQKAIEAAIGSVCAEDGLLAGWVLVAEFDHITEGRGITVFTSEDAPEWQTGGYLQYAFAHMEDEDDAY